MSSTEQYRAHAHDCLLRANTDTNDRDRPLWLTLAQSWLQLAEHADRVNGEKAINVSVAHDEEAIS